MTTNSEADTNTAAEPRAGNGARGTGPALEAHYRFTLWLVPVLERFPRSQKFLLADRMQGAAQDVLESLIEATYTRQRAAHLASANLGLEKPLLLPAHIRQPVVPPSLQLGRDKAVSWIDGIVLALCQIGLVARLRQRQLCLPSDLGVVALTGLDGGQRRFDAERR